MTRISWFAGIRPRFATPRSVLSWLILVVLVAGASAYSQGSRYALVPAHGTLYSAPYQDPERASLPAESGGCSADAPDLANPGTTHDLSPSQGSTAPQQECCERRSAPRSQPAPLRTAALDPPVLAHRPFCADGILPAASPPAPELPALTVVELSISRT